MCLENPEFLKIQVLLRLSLSAYVERRMPKFQQTEYSGLIRYSEGNNI